MSCWCKEKKKISSKKKKKKLKEKDNIKSIHKLFVNIAAAIHIWDDFSEIREKPN